MGYDVSPLETDHLVIAHQRGMTVVPLAGFQNALKLRVVIRVPPPCGPMLCTRNCSWSVTSSWHLYATAQTAAPTAAQTAAVPAYL